MYEDLKPEDCACALLRSASRSLTRAYETALKPSGLSTSQFTLLSVIQYHKKGLAITKLAEVMNLDRTTLTRNLAPLERDGLLSIKGGEDQRTKLITIAKRGSGRLKIATPLWQAVQGGLIEKLGPKKWARVEALLADLSKAVA